MGARECGLAFFRSAWLVRMRLFTALILLIGAALLCTHKLLKQTRPLSPRAASDEAGAYEERFTRARQFLPQHGVVCYRPDFNSSETAKKGFFLARYALAPLVVRTAPDCDPLIADFPLGPPASFLGNRYTVLQDFGHGVLLLKRNER